MLLAGDIGATKTLLGLFTRGTPRPAPTVVRAFRTGAFHDLGDIVASFLQTEGVPHDRLRAACFGVAGPVIHGRAQLTNAGWPVVAADVGRRFGVRDVRLLNDLEATAWSLPVLTASELEVLQCGEDSPGGNAAIIAAGTGLGMAIALRSGTRFLPVASEGGHATFAPTTEREIALLRQLTALRGRAQWEDIVSGPGLVTLHAFTHATACSGVPAGLDLSAMPAAISEAALRNRCPACREALHLFVSAYGSAAGDLALIATATGGLYLGGGIAPKILPALRSSAFMTAFGRKAPMEALMARIPVQVILNPEAALLGAATHASAPAGPGGTALN